MPGTGEFFSDLWALGWDATTPALMSLAELSVDERSRADRLVDRAR